MPEIIVIDTKYPEKSKTINVFWSTQLTDEWIIGRDPSCRIVLNDTLVSRRHGKFILRNNNLYYCDLNSRNGSKINNKITKPDQEYLLKPLDTIILGNHLLWIKAILEVVSSSTSAANPLLTAIPRSSSDPTLEEEFSSNEISSEFEEEPLVLNELHDNAPENFTGILTETSMSFPNLNNQINNQNDLVCNHCSHHNPINGKFCTKCGSKLVK